MRTYHSIILLLGTLFFFEISPTGARAGDFESWLNSFRAEALEKGISKETLDRSLTGINPIPRVIELDRRQPEFTLTYKDYIKRVVTKTRIAKARKLYDSNRALLSKVSKKFHVQPRFIVALWGIESDFGRLTGGFKIVPALATLAHEGRRSAFFRSQLLKALTIIDQGHISAENMQGSWAGAIGQVQFFQNRLRAACHTVQFIAGMIGMRDADHFHLFKLVLTQHARSVAAR